MPASMMQAARKEKIPNMKASELIKQLEELMQAHGDLVMSTEYDTITGAEFRDDVKKFVILEKVWIEPEEPVKQ